MIPAPITTILSGTAFSDNAPVDDNTVSSSIWRNNSNILKRREIHCMQCNEARKRGIHPGFETQGRRYQKSKTGYQWSHKKGWCHKKKS